MPELWNVRDYAWVIRDGDYLLALDVPSECTEFSCESVDAIWLTSWHPDVFDLKRLAQLPRGIKIIIDRSFPNVEAEFVEFLNFVVHRLAGSTFEQGRLSVTLDGSGVIVRAGTETATIVRPCYTGYGNQADLPAQVIPVKPMEHHLFGDKPFVALAPRLAEALSAKREGTAWQPFESDQQQRHAFAEVGSALQSLGTRLGCLLAAYPDGRLTAAVSEGIGVMILDGPGSASFAFGFDVSRYEFLPVQTRLAPAVLRHIVKINLQDYWAVIQGNVLAWELTDGAISSTDMPVTDAGVNLATLWRLLHESRFEPTAVTAYYYEHATRLLDRASLSLLTQGRKRDPGTEIRQR